MTKETIFYYLHGFEAKFDLDSQKVKAFNTLLPIVGLTVNYLEKEDLNKLEKDIQNVLKNKNIIFVGSSLGGYFAKYFAEKYDMPSVLLNPSLFPITALKKDGISKNKLAHLADYHTPNNNKYPFMLLLAKDDNIVHYQETIYSIGKNVTTVIKENGGHRLTNIEEFLPDVVLYLNSTINNIKKTGNKI